MDKEIVVILEALLNSSSITATSLQEEYNYTKRQVIYRINKINDMLKAKKVPLIYLKSNKEIVINKETKEEIKVILGKNYSKNTYYFSKEERILCIYLMLFINMEYLSINHLTDFLKVSRSTANSDFKELLPELKEKGILVKNSRVNGYYLAGSEIEIRRVLIKNIIESLSNKNSSRVFDIFIKEYKLDSYNEAKENILTLARKFGITFVEDRLIEFIYIFIFLKARMYSKRRNTMENIDIPKVSAMSSMKEYKFAKELLEMYEEEDIIKKHDITYISAWVLGISVGNYDEDTEDRPLISEIVNKITMKFRYLSGMYYISQKKIYEQLYSHFRPAYYRLLFKLPIYNPLCSKVKEEYKLVYRIVSNTMNEFYSLFGEEIQEEELAYLTMHFAVFFSDRNECGEFRKKVALVTCSNGVGSSVILHSELTSLFPDIHFLPPVEMSSLKNFADSVDIIFTTNYKVEGIRPEIPVIKVSPVMTAQEKYKVAREVYIKLGEIYFKQPKVDEVMEIIKKYADITSEDMLSNELSAYFRHIENPKQSENLTENHTIKEGEGPMLSEITNKSLIRLNIQAKDWEDAIRQSASALVENDKVSQEYVDAMITSTKEAGPYIVITKHVALPHARPEAGAKDIAIGIATLETPIEFGNDENDPVKYVFCLSAVDSNSHLRAMSELVELLDNEEFFRTLDNAKNTDDIMKFIKENEA